MNVALRRPRMTRDEFLAWAEVQEAKYEFDGFDAVAMTRPLVNHGRAVVNLLVALKTRLAGTGCEPLAEAGVATIGDAVRYPDVLVTCARVPGTARLVEAPVVVFEVLSPTSGRTDRIDKLREYWAVPSIRRYVLIERTSAAMTVFGRADVVTDWTASALTAGETLDLPELGIGVPVDEIFAGLDLPTETA